MSAKILNEVKEIFLIKTYMRAYAYSIEPIKLKEGNQNYHKNKKYYIRPNTTLMFKNIDKNRAKEMYDSVMPFIYKKLDYDPHEYNTKYIKNPDGGDSYIEVLVHPTPNLNKLTELIKNEIRQYFDKQAKLIFSESEFEIISERLDTLELLLEKQYNFAEIISFVLEANLGTRSKLFHDIAQALFNRDFEEVDMNQAADDLWRIGKLTATYDLHHLYHCAINKAKLDVLKEAVEKFANKYGLLGILNEVFPFNPDKFKTTIDMEKTRVDTPINEIIRLVNTEDSRYTYEDSLEFFNTRTMVLSEYIKFFFPDISMEQNFEWLPAFFPDILADQINKSEFERFKENYSGYGITINDIDRFNDRYHDYAQMDYNYWIRYSEPLGLFLLSARIFYEELKVVSGDSKLKPCINFDNINISYEFNNNEDYNTNVFLIKLNSLYDAIRYRAIYYTMVKSKRNAICINCYRPFLKDKNHKKYCSLSCGNAHRSDKSKKNKREKDTAAGDNQQ